MTAQELKSKIRNDIDNLNDPKVLEMMDMILDTYKGNSNVISEKHRDFLAHSEESRIFTHEEAQKLVDEWLKD